MRLVVAVAVFFSVFGKPAPRRGHAQKHVLFREFFRKVRQTNAFGCVSPVLLSLPHHSNSLPGLMSQIDESPIGSLKPTNLMRNLTKFHRLPIWHSQENDFAERKMDSENDSAKSSSAEKFRDYANECRRLAQRAAEKDRQVLMEIADAWMACVDDAERKEKAPERKR